MGSVYLARDLVLERDVAIKFISHDKASDPSARHRLIREARAAAALDHPTICGVHEVIVEPDGRAAIVMQYVEGETLAAILRRGPLDARFALSIATDLTKALAAAHKRGIIHRDIKPQNVIITPDRQAKLLDFGVARQHEIVAAPSSDTTTVLTTPGVIVGTPAYMSPEQVQQQPIDGRSDLFSLGAVLYESLTGKRPFTGRSAIDVLGAILHQTAPDASTIRPELTDQHDEVLRRLLAKHHDDRFKSAEELLGALQVLVGTQRTYTEKAERQPSFQDRLRGLRHSRVARITVATVLVLVVIFAWSWRLPEGAPNPAAADWYRRGVDAIRDGSYYTARLRLNEAITSAPNYAPAYVRLAEAETELDDPESAQRALLRVAEIVRLESRLAFEDRQRYRAVRFTQLREVDRAVDEYEVLAREKPQDVGVLLDLGRAQEAAGRRGTALDTYDRALKINPQYAPAHLRRGEVLAIEGKASEALAELAIAERLYQAASNLEGEVETQLRRGVLLNQRGELKPARVALERAISLSGQLRNRAQEIKARLQLSSVTTSEGNYKEAELMARSAIDDALKESLDIVAAEGLIDLAAPVLLGQQARRPEVDGYLLRAIELADKRQARRIAGRAALQRASLKIQDGRYDEALAIAKAPLEYFKSNRYRQTELFALAITARANELLGNYSEARRMAEQALSTAEEIKDEAQIALALENLGGSANAMGALPDALRFRVRGLEIHRKQRDMSVLGFDLLNNADLLIRLGRHDEASKLLDEIDAGIAANVDAFVPRGRRARMLRAVSAAIRQQPSEVWQHAKALRPVDGKPDQAAQMGELLAIYTKNAPLMKPPQELVGSTSSTTGRELRYWQLVTRLATGDVNGALAGAGETLGSKDVSTSLEFEWRIAAIGAAAARAAKDDGRQRAFLERAGTALDRLRSQWKSDAASYEARPDLVDLRRKAGLN
jgi:tetratricopeptide (TPR) repeat protein